MHVLNDKESTILKKIIEGLSEKRPYKKIDNKPGVEIPVQVEIMKKNLFRVYRKTEDGTRSIEMRFLKLPEGHFIPVWLKVKDRKNNFRESTVIKNGEIISQNSQEHIKQLDSARVYLYSIKNEQEI